MTEVVSVKFRGKGKSYFFDPAGVQAKAGDKLVVETSKGMELGDCVIGNHMVEDSATVQPLRPVIRMATADDLRVEEINRAREKEAMEICQEKIRKHGLEMKLVDVECSFEGNKILFFFTADGRVDFRELVKDLAGVFRTRIELRQIGVRDEAKMLGGLGICGRPFCCSAFLDDFQPVSTKMAKTQSMSLNPVKISGTCGRLMCCLRYEQDAYEDLVKHVPKNGAFVQTPDGYGNVTLVNLLRQNVKVKLDGSGEAVFHNYSVDEIAEVPGGRPPEGQPLPQVLEIKPRPPREKPQKELSESRWIMPSMLPEETVEEPDVPQEEKPERKKNHRHNRSRGKGGDKPRAESTEKPGAPAPEAERPQKKQPRPNRQGNAPKQGAAKAPAPKASAPKTAAPRAEKPAGEGEAAHRRRNRPKGNGGNRSKGETPRAE